LHLTLHLTGRCNMRCRYCYDSAHGGADMTFDTVKAAVRIAVRENGSVSNNVGIVFFGGEPLIKRKLIEQTVAHCEKLSKEWGTVFNFQVTTNGLLLDESFLNSPLTGRVLLALSHDGIQAAHDANRVDALGQGTFERLEQISDMVLRAKPYTPVMTTITPDTVGYYADSVDFLFRKGFRYLVCTLDYSGQWERKHFTELKRQYKQLSDWYYKLTMKEEKFYFSPFEAKIASHVFPGKCMSERCELGRKQVSIGPDGKIFPCVQFVGSPADSLYNIGNVKTGIDDAARRRLYELNARQKKPCSWCAIRERCNHHCACLNKQVTGSIEQVAPTLCAHERFVLPIVDKLAERLYDKRSSMFIQKHYNEMYPLISLVEDNWLRRCN
jgi:uncharacterized protein